MSGNDEYGTLALRLASALGRYWYTHGLAVEGSEWLAQALAAAPDAPEVLRANALRLLGVLMDQQQNLDRAWELFQEAHVIFQKLGDRAGEAKSLNSMGIVARARQDLDSSLQLLFASTLIRRELGDEAGLATSLNNLGWLYIDRGELDKAFELFEEVMELDRNLKDDWGVACTLNNLAVLQLERGDISEAQSMGTEALQSLVELGDLDAASEGMEVLAGVAAAEGEYIRAARLAGAADSLRNSIGIPLPALERARIERWLEKPRTELEERAFKGAWDEGTEMTKEQAFAYALRTFRSGVRKT
jgi:tetratricopeptide (TPR) repeat protein